MIVSGQPLTRSTAALSRPTKEQAGSLPQTNDTVEIQADPKPANKAQKFTYQGLAEDLSYRSVSDAQGGRLEMKREAKLVDVGGFYVEGDPVFHLKGKLQGVNMQLQVQPEILITNFGGISVQTGTVYHIAGNLGANPYQATITSEDHITNIGGINVQTGSTQTLQESGSKLTCSQQVETSNVGGILVESDRFFHVSRDDRSMQVRAEGNRLETSGELDPQSMALVAALRPFLLQ